MKKRIKEIDDRHVRVIKISKDALIEFIYENMIDNESVFLDVDPEQVINSFDIDFSSGQFIFCAYKAEDENGKTIDLPKEINLKSLMRNIPDTASTMYDKNRYREYTKDELILLSKEG